MRTRVVLGAAVLLGIALWRFAAEPRSVERRFSAPASGAVGLKSEPRASNSRASSAGALQEYASELEGTGAAPEDLERLSGAIRRWAERDPKGAACWLLARLTGARREEAIRQTGIVWANSDLAGAVAWARRLPEGEDRQTAVLAIGYEASRSEPLTALTMAVELPPSSGRDDLLAYAASQWTSEEPAAAAAWAKSVPDEDLRERLVEAVAVAWATRDGRSAANLTAEALPRGGAQNRAAVEVARRWAVSSPKGAASWVEQFSDPEVQAIAARGLVRAWAYQDISAASNWARSLPPGRLREETLRALASSLPLPN